MCECTILLKTCLLCLTSRFLWFFCYHMQYCSEYSCCSVTQSYPTLYNPMECSTPGFPVLHHLPEFVQTLVHWVNDAIQSSYHLVTPFSFCAQSSPASESFPVSQLFPSGGQRTRTSASASVLLMNIQGWLTVWSACCPRDSEESCPAS